MTDTAIPFAALAATLAVPEEALRPFAWRIAAGIASANQAPALPADLAPAFAVEDAAVLILAWHARAAGTPVALSLSAQRGQRRFRFLNINRSVPLGARGHPRSRGRGSIRRRRVFHRKFKKYCLQSRYRFRL
jgi:hypothetical protein